MNTAFSGRETPLVPGSIYGVRTFRILPNGTLRSLYSDTYWRKGENRAKCQIQSHRAGASWCTCGFYAYYGEGSARYLEPNVILGVVEGYGKVTLGGLGFRAEKSRIVALFKPGYVESEKTRLPLLRRFIVWHDHLVRTSVIRTFLVMTLALFGLACTISSSAVDSMRPYSWYFASIPLVTMAYTTLSAIMVNRVSVSKRTGLVRILLSSGDQTVLKWMETCGSNCEDFTFQRAVELYEVPVYGTASEMLKKHPTTKYSEIKHLGEGND